MEGNDKDGKKNLQVFSWEQRKLPCLAMGFTRWYVAEVESMLGLLSSIQKEGKIIHFSTQKSGQV